MIRILDVARAQLVIDLNCTEEDLLQEEQIRYSVRLPCKYSLFRCGAVLPVHLLFHLLSQYHIY